jgi:hypothetical protein
MRAALRLVAALMLLFAFDAVLYGGYYGQAVLGAAARQGTQIDFKIHDWMRRAH